jgi:hypothetical protein
MSIVRQYSGEVLDAQNNPIRKVIRYLVPSAVTSTAAVDSLKATEIDYGDTDPDDATNGLLATDFRAIERIGAGSEQGFFVEVTLTRGGGGGFTGPNIPNQDEDYRLTDLTTETRRLRLPVFKQITAAYPGASGVVMAEDWVRDDREFEQTFQILRVRCNLPSGTYLGTNFDQVISPEVNKIHQLYASSTGLNRWRFIGAQANQVNADVFRITYEWEQDRGTDAPENALANNGTIDPMDPQPILLPDDRPAYHDWEAYAEPLAGPVIGPLFEPKIVATRKYIENLTGANAFPGNPKAAL